MKGDRPRARRGVGWGGRWTTREANATHSWLRTTMGAAVAEAAARQATRPSHSSRVSATDKPSSCRLTLWDRVWAAKSWTSSGMPGPFSSSWVHTCKRLHECSREGILPPTLQHPLQHLTYLGRDRSTSLLLESNRLSHTSSLLHHCCRSTHSRLLSKSPVPQFTMEASSYSPVPWGLELSTTRHWNELR